MTDRLAPLRGALVALAALAGLFAMHGLSHHGEHLPSHAVAEAQAGEHAAHAGHDRAAVDTATTHDTPPLGAAAVVCLAILMAGLLAWSGVRRPRRGLLLRLPPAGSVAVPRPQATRSHDPPDRWSLSVCRC